MSRLPHPSSDRSGSFAVSVAALHLLAAFSASGASPCTDPDMTRPVPGWQAPSPGEHPKLFFRQGDIPELRARAQTPEGQALLGGLRSQLAESYTLWHGVGYGLLYVVTDDRAYADTARTMVQRAFDGTPDRDPQYSFTMPAAPLRAGPSVAAIAMAYDLCYNGWAPSFREEVAGRLMNYSPTREMSLETMSLYPPHNASSNHWGAIVGGAGLTVLAIRGDPGANDSLLVVYLKAIRCYAQYGLRYGWGDHGWFAEGQGPSHVFANAAFVPFLQALRVAAGEDFVGHRSDAQWITMRWAMEILPRAGRPYYPCRHPSTYGTEDFLRTADRTKTGITHGGWFSQGFGAIAEQQKPALLWTYEKFVAPAEKRVFDLGNYPHRAMFSLVNWPFGATAVNPGELIPHVLADEQKGYYVFRNRWQDDNDIIVTALLGMEWEQPYDEVGAENVMVWGLGMRTVFPGMFNRAFPTHLLALPDGSGTLSAVAQADCDRQAGPEGDSVWVPNPGAAVTALAVDYSGLSGADAFLVMTGPMAGKTADNNGNLSAARITTVTGPNNSFAVARTAMAGGTPFYIQTLRVGNPPPVLTDSGSILVGERRVRFDGRRLILTTRDDTAAVKPFTDGTPGTRGGVLAHACGGGLRVRLSGTTAVAPRVRILDQSGRSLVHVPMSRGQDGWAATVRPRHLPASEALVVQVRDGNSALFSRIVYMAR